MTPEQKAGRAAYRERLIAHAEIQLEKATRLGYASTRLVVHRREFRNGVVRIASRPVPCTFVAWKDAKLAVVDVSTDVLRQHLAAYEAWADSVGK